MVNTYSLRTHKSVRLAANFTVGEFACKDGSDKVLVDSSLATVLQKIRNHFAKPVTITSAYRTSAYNKKIGGAANSQHVKGTAADIVIQGVAPIEVARYCEYLLPNSGGIGLYSGFVHIDVRTVRSRWEDYGTEKTVQGFPGYKECISNAVDAITFLYSNRIINTPEVWNNGTWTDDNVKQLIIKVANYIKNGGV